MRASVLWGIGSPPSADIALTARSVRPKRRRRSCRSVATAGDALIDLLGIAGSVRRCVFKWNHKLLLDSTKSIR
jgi:hypothetical protein